GPLTAALAAVKSFGWIVFASRHAVAAVLERLPAAPQGVHIAAVGQATAQVLRQRGWPVDLVPDEASAAALIDAFAARFSARDAGVKMLYPASSRALPTPGAGHRAHPRPGACRARSHGGRGGTGDPAGTGPHYSSPVANESLRPWDFLTRDRDAPASRMPGAAWCARLTSRPMPSSIRCSSCPGAPCATRSRACPGSFSSRWTRR